MPAAASAEPMIAMPMPASPQKISSTATGSVSPVWSLIAFMQEVDAVQPVLRRLLDDRPRELLTLVPLVCAGRMTSTANSWTHFWICCWSSLRESENSAMRLSYHWVTSPSNVTNNVALDDFASRRRAAQSSVRPDSSGESYAPGTVSIDETLWQSGPHIARRIGERRCVRRSESTRGRGVDGGVRACRRMFERQQEGGDHDHDAEQPRHRPRWLRPWSTPRHRTRRHPTPSCRRSPSPTPTLRPRSRPSSRASPDGCDPLDTRSCLLPFPSERLHDG